MRGRESVRELKLKELDECEVYLIVALALLVVAFFVS